MVPETNDSKYIQNIFKDHLEIEIVKLAKMSPKTFVIFYD